MSTREVKKKLKVHMENDGRSRTSPYDLRTVNMDRSIRRLEATRRGESRGYEPIPLSENRKRTRADGESAGKK